MAKCLCVGSSHTTKGAGPNAPTDGARYGALCDVGG